MNDMVIWKQTKTAYGRGFNKLCPAGLWFVAWWIILSIIHPFDIKKKA